MTTILAALQAISTNLQTLNTTLQNLGDYASIVAGLNAIEDAIGGNWNPDGTRSFNIDYVCVYDPPSSLVENNKIYAYIDYLAQTIPFFINWVRFRIPTPTTYDNIEVTFSYLSGGGAEYVSVPVNGDQYLIHNPYPERPINFIVVRGHTLPSTYDHFYTVDQVVTLDGWHEEI